MFTHDVEVEFGPLPKTVRKQFVWNGGDWWNWFKAFRRKPSESDLIERLEEYDDFICFHSCRPEDVTEYYKHGFRIADQDTLSAVAKHRLLSAGFPQITEQIVDAAIAGASRKHDAHLFVFLDELDLSAHYLIYGSEHMVGIAARITRDVGFDARQIMKKFGIPTLFRIALPRELIPPFYIEVLAKCLLDSVWEFKRRKKPPKIDFSFTLREPIPKGTIINHYHPDNIPDPLLQYAVYRVGDKPPMIYV